MQRIRLGLLALWMGVFVSFASAAQFSVSPVRIDFSAQDKTSSITVLNMGDRPLRIALEAKRWEQDQGGADVYIETSDLLFFPKQAEIAPYSKRVIRIGMLVPRAENEQAYRLYVNEQPPLKSEGGSQLAMVLSFGVPVFIQPERLNLQALAERVTVKNTKLSFTLKNTGNATLKLVSMKSEALKLDQREFNDWYLQAGAQRDYQFSLDACKPGPQQVDITFDRHALHLPLALTEALCEK
jgi:fimbrial chaperone protein